MITDAGYAVQMDKPEDFNVILQEFFDEIFGE